MALPTSYYTRQDLSTYVFVIRVNGGYWFTVNLGNNVTGVAVSDAQSLAAYVAVSGLPADAYTVSDIGTDVKAVRIDGGWIILQNMMHNMTGTFLSYDQASGKGIGTDHHSGLKNIPLGETYTITQNKQMIVKDGIKIDGTLVIDGDLALI